MANNIFSHIDKFKVGLDASWLRNEILANNIANVDTPNFKRSDVRFSKILEDSISMKTTRDKHINPASSSNYTVEVYEDSNTNVRMDGNNVDIEREMNELAKNAIWYNYLTHMVTKEIKLLDLAINGGR
ncbi:MAG TPA: flagellar basal body rod protein FlgB [Clostridiaceae bacterium]|jgi:flagellar basal-body rod protein FlgB|nr:flagellar basal body rod protein FlgB [Clostridiaceae bacterium]